MILKMNNFGKVLSTREEGRILHDKIKSMLENNNVIIDFEGVELVTNSFADEFIGKLLLEMELEELKQKTSFINVNNFVNIIIVKVINNRLEEANS